MFFLERVCDHEYFISSCDCDEIIMNIPGRIARAHICDLHFINQWHIYTDEICLNLNMLYNFRCVLGLLQSYI